jgi:ATP-dependent DNA helicase RecG
LLRSVRQAPGAGEQIVVSESQNIEYKQSLSEKHEAAIALAAFATSEGGEVHFGIAPNGRRVGVLLGKVTLEELANYIKQNTDPPIFPSIKVEGDETSAVVIVRVEESPIKPVWAFGRPYKRVGRTNQGLSREETQRLSDYTRGFTWDALPCPHLGIQHLDRMHIDTYLRRSGQEIGKTTETVLDTLDLRSGDLLLNGAALLFAADPQRWIVGSVVQCARFQGQTSVRFLANQTLYGDIITQIEEAISFVTRNTRQTPVITGRPQHEVVSEYPPEAVREAIINAICHRDYTAAGTVQVRIYDDRLEVWNPANLPPGFNMEALYHEHVSKPRNKRIAEAFHRAQLIERWGTGTLRIVGAYTVQQLPPPEFLYQDETFIVRMMPAPLPIETSVQPRTLDLSGLNERQHKAISYIREHGSITLSEFLTLVDVTDRQARRDLQDLQTRGILVRYGQSKATNYKLS